MRWPILLLLAILVAVAAAIAAPAGAQMIHDRIYFPPKEPLSLEGLPAGARLATVTTADQLTLTHIETPPQPGKPLLLVFHGNASSATRVTDWLAPLIAEGWGVLAAEYRGYSANPGYPTEKTLAIDADAYLARARQLAPGHRIITVGHSLGGGVAFGLAQRNELDALVTIGTFSRLRLMAPRLARAFMSDRYENEAAVAALDEPYFLIHGLRDETVPAEHGNTLHKAASVARKDGASFVLTQGAHTPDSATLAAVLRAIEARLETGAYPPLASSETKIVPFGQSKPINP